MGDIEWEDPAPSKTGPKWDDFSDRLRANPGRWAILPGSEDLSPNYAIGTSINHGLIAAFRPAGAFEATARMQPSGRRRTYVRYVGLPDDLNVLR